MPSSPDELFDIVNDRDEVVGQARRADVHAQGLLHRAVSIFVFNTRGQLLMQLRTATKDQYPLCWTSSCSGHVDAGEDYATAAQREMVEELGLTVKLTELAKFDGGPETANEFTVLYSATADAIPAAEPEEIERVEFVDVDEVARQIAETPDNFTPPFRTFFDWYRRNSR